ncbi:hypothetical protein ABZS94_28545 [Streptomyces sp. NPDC005500]
MSAKPKKAHTCTLVVNAPAALTDPDGVVFGAAGSRSCSDE